MVIASFADDKVWTERARALIVRDLYPRLAYEGQFVSIAGASAGSGFLQRIAHIDAVVQTGPGVSVTVEEKIVRRKYDCFAIESHSNLERGEQDGWIFNSTADMLIYAFGIDHGLECWVMPLPALRRWFIGRMSTFRIHDVANGWGGQAVYHTRVYLVPIRMVSCQKSQFILKW